MKWQVRYILMNGGELMLLRKYTLFGWRPYRPHSNLLNEKYEKLNKLYKEMEKVNGEIKELKSVEFRERKRIEGAREHPKGYGPVLPEKMKLPYWPIRVKATVMTDFSFEKLLGLFKGKGVSTAAGIAGLSGVTIKEVDGRSIEGEFEETTDEPVEICGERTYDIKPESRNQQRKKGQQQNNQQN